MREKIVVMGGSFNPPTIAHQRLMLGAVETLGAARGIFVPSSHAYVSAKMRRDKHRNEVLPEEARLRMLLAMAADDPRPRSRTASSTARSGATPTRAWRRCRRNTRRPS